MGTRLGYSTNHSRPRFSSSEPELCVISVAARFAGPVWRVVVLFRLVVVWPWPWPLPPPIEHNVTAPSAAPDQGQADYYSPHRPSIITARSASPSMRAVWSEAPIPASISSRSPTTTTTARGFAGGKSKDEAGLGRSRNGGGKEPSSPSVVVGKKLGSARRLPVPPASPSPPPAADRLHVVDFFRSARLLAGGKFGGKPPHSNQGAPVRRAVGQLTELSRTALGAVVSRSRPNQPCPSLPSIAASLKLAGRKCACVCTVVPMSRHATRRYARSSGAPCSLLAPFAGVGPYSCRPRPCAKRGIAGRFTSQTPRWCSRQEPTARSRTRRRVVARNRRVRGWSNKQQ